MNPKINITEIAKQAGVSIATVSRAINDPALVKTETRERILDIIKSTNYKINYVAKNLRTNKSYSIGLIYTSVLMVFYHVISKGVEDIAIKNSYNVFFCNSGDDPVKENDYLSLLYEKRVDGIIISPTGKNDDIYKNIISSGIPVCFFDRNVRGVTADGVFVDNRKGSRQAVEYLLKKGYQKIGFISGPKRIMTGNERLKGYMEAHEALGVGVNKKLIQEGDYQYESGYRCAKELLDNNKIDALYIANEPMAAGALQLVNEKGLRFPKDIGFLMWDDPYWATLVRPNISTIAQPCYTIGTTAAELLFKKIDKGDSYMDKDSITITLNTSLVIRDST